MASPKFVEIEGKRFLWRELLQRRRDQLIAVGKTEQSALFELKEDRRSAPERTAAGRYREPGLFSLREQD
jgi:hypothetical protein